MIARSVAAWLFFLHAGRGMMIVVLATLSAAMLRTFAMGAVLIFFTWAVACMRCLGMVIVIAAVVVAVPARIVVPAILAITAPSTVIPILVGKTIILVLVSIIAVTISISIVPVTVAGAIVPFAKSVVAILAAQSLVTVTVAEAVITIPAEAVVPISASEPIIAIPIAEAVITIPVTEAIAISKAIIAALVAKAVLPPVVTVIHPASPIGYFVAAHILEPVDALDQLLPVDALMGPGAEGLSQTHVKGRRPRAARPGEIGAELSQVCARSQCPCRKRRLLLRWRHVTDAEDQDDCQNTIFLHNALPSYARTMESAWHRPRDHRGKV
jgi:hypothetical protein